LHIGELAARCGRSVHAIRFAEWQAALELLDGKLAFYEEWLATGVRPAREVRKSGKTHSAPKLRR
jgi:hypothetical protein